MKNHLSEALKGIKFKSMPNISYDIVFHRQSVMNECGFKENLRKLPFALIRRAFFKSPIEYNKSGSKVLFYLSDPIRKSSEVNFFKAVRTLPKADTLIERVQKQRFSIKGFYLLFILVPVWLTQMTNRKLTFIEKYQIVKELLDLYHIQEFFRTLDIQQYNLLVCYYDSLVHECVLNLMFQQKDISTATLEHGQFNAWRENTIINCGLEFITSHCDYHLCWNRFTKEEAIKSGWRAERLPIVGILSNIGKGKERCVRPNNGIFGVVISNPSWEHENHDLIRAANILAAKYKLRYYLKLHPVYDESYFDNEIEKKYFVGNVKKGIDTLEYANMVDFSLIGSTSVFSELVYTYHDILRYSTLLPSDKYRDVKIGCVFHQPDEVVQCYNMLNEDFKSQLFDLLCGPENTKEAYSRFFCKFIE